MKVRKDYGKLKERKSEGVITNRKAYRIEELSEEDLKAILEAEVPEEYALPEKEGQKAGPK